MIKKYKLLWMKKQATLFNLPGVVVIEEIERQNQKLKDLEVENQEKLKILGDLRRKKPSTDIIIKSGIGKTLRKLRKSENKDVSLEADRVFQAWKSEVEKREEIKARGNLKVNYDEDTILFRKKAVKLLSANRDSKAAKKAEEEIFEECGKLCNAKYRKLVRTASLKPKN